MYEPDLNTIMTVEEVCDYLRLGKNSVYSLLKSGKLPSTVVIVIPLPGSNVPA